MKQSPSKNSSSHVITSKASGGAAVTAMEAGLVLTLVALAALIVDQATVHSISDHVAALYGPLGLHPDPNELFGILYATGAIGVLLWLTMIWGVRRHRRWARGAASLVCLAATASALLVLLVSEYGTRIFPTVWGIVGLLPCMVGLLAIVMLWRAGRPQQSPSPSGFSGSGPVLAEGAER